MTLWFLYCAIENTMFFVKPPAVDHNRRRWPMVSILIPARNEAKRIQPCLEGLLALDYPHYEILVLNDRSTDGTLNVVRRYARRNPRLKVLNGKPLPTGWLGKPWACQQLAQKAKGEWLFFIDADTWHKPETLKRTVQMAEEKQADVLSLLTSQVTKTWMEALVVPVMAFHLLAYFPARWSLNAKSRWRRFAGVSGQFVFIRKKVYQAFGGHEQVKDEVVEDLNFGRKLVHAGYRLVLGDGSDFAICRMYLNSKQVWEGFSKNYFPAMKYSVPYLLSGTFFMLLNGVAPFALLFFGNSTLLFGPALVLCSVLWGIRALHAFRYHLSKISVFFHPIGCLLFAVIGFNSWLWFLFGKGRWKGRRLVRPAV